MEEFDHQKKCFTIDEYLEMEDASIEKHEFHDGSLSQTAVYSTGRNLSHNVVKGDVYTFVNLAIRGANIPHMALNSDTKVRIEAFNRFVYPDVTISDGTPEYYVTPEGATRRDIIINPLVIFDEQVLPEAGHVQYSSNLSPLS